jgi:hypothetical protein
MATWLDHVKKTFADEKKKNSDIKLKDALKIASKTWDKKKPQKKGGNKTFKLKGKIDGEVEEVDEMPEEEEEEMMEGEDEIDKGEEEIMEGERDIEMGLSEVNHASKSNPRMWSKFGGKNSKKSKKSKKSKFSKKSKKTRRNKKVGGNATMPMPIPAHGSGTKPTA